MVGRCMDYTTLLRVLLEQKKGGRSSVLCGLAAWCVSPAPACEDSAGESGLAWPSRALPPPRPVNAFRKEDVCDWENCRGVRRESSRDGGLVRRRRCQP